MYLILLFLGLLIGAVFLVVLLIGDRKEARLEARKKAVQEQISRSREPVDGSWPPPPSVPLPAEFSPYAASAPPRAVRTSNRKMVRTFFLVRNSAIAVVTAVFIVYSCFPRLPFGWVLLATALAALAVWGGLMLLQRSKQRPL